MSFELILKLNNQAVTSYKSPIRILNGSPILSWEFDTVNKVSVDPTTGVSTNIGDLIQLAYFIRIGTSDANVGNNNFIGNISQTGYVSSHELSWSYRGDPLERGVKYYGHIYAIDEANRSTDYTTFSFLYNSLPVVTNVIISPSIPAPTDNLVVSYDYFDKDKDKESGTSIRWFKNGAHQRQFDDSTIISSTFLQNDDIWSVDIYPSDGFEYGNRVTSPQVKVASASVTVSDITILPPHPNPNDILKASYEISDEFQSENVFIRWYINNKVNQDYNDMQFVRLDVEEGDQIRFEVKHNESSFYSASSTVSVVASEFIVRDISIDGQTDPLSVSTITPHVKWKRFVPYGKSVNYISIRIGTFYDASNIYSKVINGDRDTFTIPANTLEKGRDYYISIAISDTQTFNKYANSHFRVRGSRWENDVSNSDGWTLETMFVVKTAGTADDYQSIRVNDGSRFAEIRIYSSKISLISGSKIDYSVTTTTNNFLTIAGKEDDIKIYLNRDLIIDGEGVFTQESDTKILEIAHENLTSTFTIKYKYVFYTTSGYFLPDVSDEYANLQFHDYIEFQDNEVVALQGYVDGKYVFGLNPNSDNESSSIYALKSGAVKKVGTISRTYSPISRINKSPDGKTTIVAHAKGATIITGYLINPFSHELIFVDANNKLNQTLPTDEGWELVKSVNTDSAYFDVDGFHIDTTL